MDQEIRIGGRVNTVIAAGRERGGFPNDGMHCEMQLQRLVFATQRFPFTCARHYISLVHVPFVAPPRGLRARIVIRGHTGVHTHALGSHPDRVSVRKDNET